ncbi:MAG: Coenzyme F420 hydrogenase/dehydrogenase, beta subunit C-terminal domain [Candidatus Bathyarchaeota archaeon]|nr:Coenzyme F420 hydrogenase/dehydrogenase, beta subunit C-terminal domain [Candidatus Bathyarchaeota archaeon]
MGEETEVTLTIDGVEVKARRGASLLEVAKQLGIEIPTLCYHSALTPFGACRLCSVEIMDTRGRKRIVTSCNYPAEEGLVVNTKSESVINVRRKILELLLARCPKAIRIKNLASMYGIKETNLWVEDESEDCILCGLCTRVCSEIIGVSAINFANRGVKRVITTPYNEFSEDCIGCGACATICPTGSRRVRTYTYATLRPLTGPKRDEHIGVYSEIFSAKSPIAGQDGGVVTYLLISGLKKGLFNKVVVVQRIEGYLSDAVIASNVEDIMKASGTKYVRAKIVPKLKELINGGERKIAVVGTPCQARAARRIQQVMQQDHPDLDITIIGLFCYEAFDYGKLKSEVKRLLGVDLDSVEKTQIRRGVFTAIVKGREYSCRVRELENAIEKGCVYCNDFPAYYADVSVGSVGSEDGFSTVVVRTEKGKKLLEEAELTMREARIEEVVRLSALKKERAKKNFAPILKGIYEVRLAGRESGEGTGGYA